MNALYIAGEYRAVLAGAVTDGDDEVKGLSLKHIGVFRTLLATVNAHFR